MSALSKSIVTCLTLGTFVLGLAVCAIASALEGETSARTSSAPELAVEKTAFGKTAEGEQVDLYTMTNANGMKVKVMTYGATLISVEVPDRDDKFVNVTLYLDSLDEYLAGTDPVAQAD